MILSPIRDNQFSLWKEMREDVYCLLDDEFHEKEMKQIFVRSDWYCYFLKNNDDQILGLVELSSRNIVDGCLSSPVAYIEGLYLKKEYRAKGIGKKAVETIKNWCKENGFSELGTDTELKNINAQKFFKSAGFQESYRIVEFYTKID